MSSGTEEQYRYHQSHYDTSEERWTLVAYPGEDVSFHRRSKKKYQTTDTMMNVSSADSKS